MRPHPRRTPALHRRLAVPAAAAGLLLSGVLGMVAARAGTLTSAVTGGGMQVLTGDVLAGLGTLSSTAVDPSTPVQVGVVLADPAASGLDAAYRAVYDPASPQYHHFLTAAEVAARFGVPSTTVSAVRSWSTRDGLSPVFTSTDGTYLLLSGTAAQAEQTFSVPIRQFQDQGVSFYANTAGPTVPSAVSGVVGLDDFLRFHTSHSAPSATAPHGTAPLVPAGSGPAGTAQDTCVGSTCIGLTTPEDLWSVYDQPTNLSDPGADFGQGQQLAVLGEGAVAGPVSDLRAFEKEFGLPQVPVTIASIGDTFKDTSGSPEWDIDTQASTGMAPKAYGETLYFANDLTDSSVLADFQAWSGDAAGPKQANASFGECEEDPTSPVLGGSFNDGQSPLFPVLAGPAGTQFTTESEQALQEATLQGKTLFSSTGDTGSSCPVVGVDVNGIGNEAFPETSYPASSRYAVAVGGTVLYTSPNTATAPLSNAQRTQETAWTFTGGGNTFYIQEPDYQQGISLLDNQDCLTQPSGTPYSSPTPCRGVPDVAAQSGDVISNGYSTTMGGQADQAGGGTSLSSPLWMGMWARIQAVAPSTPNGYTFGFANETLYKIGKDPGQDPTAFFDIGGGPPTSPTTANGYYASLPRSPLDPTGWDYVSGLGAPDVIHLAQDASGSSSLTLTNDQTAPVANDCGQPGLPNCTSGGTSSCPAGGPLWTNPAHVATDSFGNQDPQLSLLSGNLSVSGSNLVATLTVTNLSTTVPTGATGAAWYATWQYQGTNYFAEAEVGPAGTVDYSDGVHSSSGYQSNNTDNGTFVPGPNGTITIDVPLANVGSPQPGAVLGQPAGVTYTQEGVPPNPVTGGSGAQLPVDSGGPGCDYTVPSATSTGAATAPGHNGKGPKGKGKPTG